MADLVPPLPPSKLRLLFRVVEVTIANQPQPTPGKGAFFEREPNALVVDSLRVQFDIKRSVAKGPNPGLVKISNMAPDSRGRFSRMPVYVILRAGHDGVLRPLMEGNVTHSISELKRTDWVTKVQFADGGRSYARSEFTRSYAPPVRALQVLSDAAGAMGLTLPPEAEQSPELRQALEAGVSVHGPTRDTLTKLLARYGFNWSVQNGRLQILKQGQTNRRRAWVVSEDVGMIGSPDATLPHKPGKPSELVVKVLLFPEIIPGDSIQLTSKNFRGAIYRVNDVHHVGDTHGNEWTTSLKCVSPTG